MSSSDNADSSSKEGVFNEKVRISGFLWKKKDGFVKRSWQRRFAQIKGSFITYFSAEYGMELKQMQAAHIQMTGGMKGNGGWLEGDESKALGTIPLSQVYVTKYDHKTRPLTFMIGHPDRRTVHFAAESDFQLRNWMTHVQRASLGPVNPPQTINMHYERLGVTKDHPSAKIRKVKT